MLKPNLSWYVLKDTDEEIPTNDYYAGNFDWKDTVDLNIRLWNNRWGDEDVEDAKDMVLELSFFYIEQNELLKDIKVYEDGQERDVQILDTLAKIKLNRNLSGKKHSLSNQDNELNYVDINIKIPIKENVRSEIKNLIVNIDYDRSEF